MVNYKKGEISSREDHEGIDSVGTPPKMLAGIILRRPSNDRKNYARENPS